MEKIVDIDLVRPSPTGRRISLSDIGFSEIKEAKTLGIIRPVVVREIRPAVPNGPAYEIVSHSRSWYLAQAAGISRIPVHIPDVNLDGVTLVDEPADSRKANPIAWAENVKSETFEVNKGGKGGRRYGGLAAIAQLRGVSVSTVSHRLRLLGLHKYVLEQLENGTLHEGHAKALTRLTTDRQANIARTIVKEKLSVRKAEELVRKQLQPDARKPLKLTQKTSVSGQPPKTKDADTLRLERMVSDACGAKASIENGTMIVLCGEDVDVLSGILHKLKLAGTGCRAIIDGPRLIVDYANDLERLDVLLRNVGVTDF